MVKFSEITPYTLDGKYKVDVPLDYLVSQLQRYEQYHNLQLCPDFQRGRVWSEEKQIAFVEHLLRGGTGSNIIRFNCPGWMRRRRQEMVLVDGLQRITAATRFLGNEIPAFGSFFHEYEDTPGLIMLTFLVNDLPTRADVLQWYLEINEGGVVHTEAEIERVRALLAAETGGALDE